MSNPVSNIRVEGDRGRFPLSISGLCIYTVTGAGVTHTHTDTHTLVHCHFKTRLVFLMKSYAHFIPGTKIEIYIHLITKTYWWKSFIITVSMMIQEILRLHYTVMINTSQSFSVGFNGL